MELCKQYAQEDDRIVFIAADHGGVSAARNLALAAATGSYVLFVDSDDVLHPLLTESLLQCLVDTGAGIAGTRPLAVPQLHWEDVAMLIKRSPGPAESIHRPHQEALDDFFHGKSPLGVMGGIMIRRDLIGDTKFNTNLFIGEDYYFIYQNLIKDTDAVFLKQRWYYYRNHPQNSGGITSYDAFWSRFYRRKLVWQSEESFGRTEYANIQKRNGLSMYLRAVSENKMSRADAKKDAHRSQAAPKGNFPCPADSR